MDPGKSHNRHPVKRRSADRGARPPRAKRSTAKGCSRNKRMTARQKADLGMFLSMRELSEVTSYGEKKLNAVKHRSGFPLFENKTTLAKFQEWAFSHSAAAAAVASVAPDAPSPKSAALPLFSPQTKAYPPFR